MNLTEITTTNDQASGSAFPDTPAANRVSAAVAASPWTSDSKRVKEIQSVHRTWQSLLTVIAKAPDRAVAAESFVKQLSLELPDHTIRLGWAIERLGSTPTTGWKLDRLFDSRLGWLGKDNSVYQSLAVGFAKVHEEASPEGMTDRGLASVRRESANWLFELRENAQASNRALVWIRPPQSDEETLSSFEKNLPEDVLQTTAAVFFSRPVSGRWEQFSRRVRRWWSRRASIGIGTLLLLAISCIPTAYSIDARATVTAMNSRRVAAPIDATLLTVHKRPGDLVVIGEPLFELDGRPLRIELEALTAEIEEASKDEDISLANGEIAKAQLAGLRRQSLSRRRDLIVDRMDKLIVTSPIDGIVIQGDWQHSLGTPMEIGQTLLEIAPSDSVEVELEIPEVEIGYVDADADVKLWFPAVGDLDFRTNVQTVYPSATIRNDENVFIAKTPMPSGEATRGGNASGESVTPLRVGMQGEATVVGPMRPWIWKWVRLPIRRLGWVIGW
ncbi:efflux RND transporter periplasmic adaptor subunit [Neorhodopirellula pilleata]|uniref:Uncharacterized protein n=1 Tax=Neorhodopirellula pilleata TaxID=2714738 RepID=A0A5C5ZL69_9BACT|nr:HlyD family efflux transporter periplasmic adaptor subunit [Neorhodopirellula pilleata]TWT87938.1 hypothetical protein Pla100_57900 [Neorhodopirellula pilleata]